MTYVLLPRNDRLQPLELQPLSWWFVLDHINPQFLRSLPKSRQPDLGRNLRSQYGFQITKREARLMAKVLRENTASMDKWPVVDQFASWAERSQGFGIQPSAPRK